MKIEPDEKNLKEQIPYPDMTFPFCVWPDVYKHFLDHTVNAHWHYDFEYGYVLTGFIDYYINDTYIKLQPGDCIFVNSNMMHMSRQPDYCDNATMFTITFPTTLLTSNTSSTIFEKYFGSLIFTQIEGFKIESDNPISKEMAALMLELLGLYAIVFPKLVLTSKTIPSSYKEYFYLLNNSREFRITLNNSIGEELAVRLESLEADASRSAYELECLKRVIQILIITQRHIDENKNALLRHGNSLKSSERAKEILTYIHAHYNERFAIEDIAKHIGISRSECFRCFKRFTNKRPVEYINEYRLQKAAMLLRETETSVTDIFATCGFENASYFSKVFKEKYKMTPLQYRKTK